MRVEMLFEIARGIGFGNGKESVVQAHLCVDSMCRADPMNRAFNLAARGRTAGLAVEIGGATQFHDFAGGIFQDLLAFDDIRVFETHFAAWPKTEIFRRWILHEIVLLDIQDAAEWNL